MTRKWAPEEERIDATMSTRETLVRTQEGQRGLMHKCSKKTSG
jgi:hypothetical protein